MNVLCCVFHAVGAGADYLQFQLMFSFFKKAATPQPRTKQQPVALNPNLVEQPQVSGVTLYGEFPQHSMAFVNELGNGLEAMMDYSPEVNSIAVKKAEAIDASLKRMEYLAAGLEKYMNEMVMMFASHLGY